MSGCIVSGSGSCGTNRFRRTSSARCLLDIWRQAGKFEGRSAVSTWLLAMTGFKAFSALRPRKDVELEDEVANAIEDTFDDPEVATQTKIEDALRKFLTALSPDHRGVVDLVYHHETSGKRWPRSSPGKRHQDAFVLGAQDIGRTLESGRH